MFKRTPIIIALCAIACTHVANARTISADEARSTAVEFFASREVARLTKPDALQLVQQPDASGKGFYAFSAADGKGFILVASDDKVSPIVGYSYDSPYRVADIPANATSMLQSVKQYITVAPDNGPVRYRAPRRVAAKKELATPAWSQESPFNNKIPNRRLTGCVGVATAIIMRYHQHPAQGTGSVGDVSFNHTYDWRNMIMGNYRTHSYDTNQAEAVSTLVGDAAQAILTDFGQSSSSAFEVRVPSALVNHFGYDAGVSYKKRSEMDKASWEALITNEIDCNRPVLWSGQDVSSGHAFVCDGYESDGRGTYFHINWGWGGAANGYFASDAMNPTVSRQHFYNDQTTVIYNIKPATSNTRWSAIHITNDGNQPGLTIDKENIAAGTPFTLRAGALKNINNTDFAGKLALGVYDAWGQLTVTFGERNFSLQALQSVEYVDFSASIPVGTWLNDDDVVRLVTKANGSDEWMPVAAELTTLGQARVSGNTLPTFAINFPATIDGVVVSNAAPTVIKGRDYRFKVASMSPDNVVTVKANGFILTPDANGNYSIANVTCNQEIRIIVQPASEVVSRRSLWVSSGTLASRLSETETATIKDLTLFGTIDVNDFTFIREKMKLTRLDISGVSVTANGSNPANAIPFRAFYYCTSLKTIILPTSINTFKNGCFQGTGITEIEIPASVSTYEYNVFNNANRLATIIVRRPQPAFVNWCVFSGAPRNRRLIVPVGSENAYRNKADWTHPETQVIGQNATPVTECTVTFQDAPGVKFTPVTEGTTVAPGSNYLFKVETDGSAGDANLEVYANSSRLAPDANGQYTALVKANTLIYTNLRQPQKTASESIFKLTADGGGVGLATEVINVTPGRQFTIRANFLKIPQGNPVYYAAVLTDAQGMLKEVISNVVSTDIYTSGNKVIDFTCTVREATVRPGNLVRIATSLDRKFWSLVCGDKPGVIDRVDAVGNKVVYHTINMPENPVGAVVTGAATQVAHGMPLNFRVAPKAIDEVVTVLIDGAVKYDKTALADVSIPSVTKDYEISIATSPRGAESYTVVNVNPGELASKIANCTAPAFIKVVGAINFDEFQAFRDKCSAIVGLDLSLCTVKGNFDKVNSLPTNAFTNGSASALKDLTLPNNLESIRERAFTKCTQIEKITLPASVTYIGNYAFQDCSSLYTIIAGNPKPPTVNYNPFPSQVYDMTLVVPEGAYDAYSNAPQWNKLTIDGLRVYNIQIDQTRAFQYNSYQNLFKIPHPSSGQPTYSVGLPNCTARNDANNVRRPGDAFQVIDNGKCIYTYPYVDFNKNFFIPGGSLGGSGGQYIIKYTASVSDPKYLNSPQDHKVEVVFFYDIAFTAPQGVSIGLKEVPAQNRWDNVDMTWFASTGKKARLYREGQDYPLNLSDAPTGYEYRVKATQRLCVKPGNKTAEAKYENVTTTIIPDEEGLYTLANLQGDTRVEVQLVPQEGSVLTSSTIEGSKKEDVATISMIAVEGEVTPAAINAIRENFTNLQTLDLSAATNESIPDGAFSGMSELSSVTLPDCVTTIGSNAFSGCSGLETIVLNNIESIGNGAFNGCDNLTTVVINTSGTRPSAPGRRRAAGLNGINDNSFQGVNPNCLVLVNDPAVAADFNGAVNVIASHNGSRKAMTNINLVATHPFKAPGEFTLGDKEINLTLSAVDGYNPVLLPFSPSRVTLNGNELSGKNLHVLTFTDGNSEKLTYQTAIQANKPCFVTTPNGTAANDRLVFTGYTTGEAYDVAATPVAEEIAAPGLNNTLYGTYEALPANEGDYKTDANMMVLRLLDSAEGVSHAPFSIYARANNADAPTEFAIKDKDITTGIDAVYSIQEGNLTISREGTVLVVMTSQEQMLPIYNISGSLVTTMHLLSGRNTIELPAGIYIIGNTKFKM